MSGSDEHSLSIAQRVWGRLRTPWDLFVEIVVERLLPLYWRVRYRPRKRAVPAPSQVRSVLVWNVDSLGDLTWTTPALRALRRGYPGAHITMICNRSYVDLLASNPHIDTLAPVEAERFYSGYGLFHRMREIEGQHFDVMVILEMGSRPADAARLLSRRGDVGYSVSTNLGMLKSLTDHTIPPNDTAQPDYWPIHFLKCVEHLGLAPVDPQLEIFPTEEDREVVARWKRETTPASALPVIGFHPCVAAYANLTKKWPQDHFVELARLLLAKRPVRFVLTGSCDERAECEELASRIRQTTGADVISVSGQFSPRELVELLASFELVVVADTAVLHLAAAAGTRTIGLFGATGVAKIAPRSDRCIALSEHLPCSPCHRDRDRMPFWPTCIFTRQECMYALTPARVAEAADRLLGG